MQNDNNFFYIIQSYKKKNTSMFFDHVGVSDETSQIIISQFRSYILTVKLTIVGMVENNL